MKHILLITTSFGKYKDSHTIRLDNMFSGLSDEYIITMCYPDVITNTYKDNGVNYISIKSNKRLRALDYSRKINKNLYLLLANIIKRFSEFDSFYGTSKKILNYFKKDESFKYDIIITASGSLESHRAGYLLSKMFNVPHVLDYGDPIFPLLKGKSQKKCYDIEYDIIKNANHIIYTTNSTLKQYDEYFKLKYKSSVIRYGYKLEDIELSKINIDVSLDFNKIKYISHIGTAFTNDRDLRPLISAVADINFGLILAGKRSKAFSKLAYDLNITNFCDLDIIDLESSIFIQKKSYINIIVGNKDGRQVPGKVFICIACRRPILYIKQCDNNDESLDILKDYKNCVVVENNKQSILFGIDKLSKMKQEPSSIITTYDTKTISLKLESILNEI
ncbi:hypothetical protein [Photobacterium phosphoreum]|uniref:hypothetical protein n=1 Tax=Photobacterium phosphoreum TaxID=659 RepID=UPI001E3D541C|nr:hypothetical protein [Photobacterium phosphoreum]MCD9511859.1 hypothetical protein [Photobacterium phosphoreum]